MRLTQANIGKAAKDAKGKAEHFEWDDDLAGFGLRFRDGGSQTWVVQYKIGTKHRRMTLGSTAMLTAEQARNGWKDQAGEWHDGAALILANARQGTDAANKRAKRRTDAGKTFDVLSADFLDFQQERRRPAYHEATKRYLNQHWKPLHRLALASIDRETIAAQLRVIEKENGPVAADRARAALSKFFGWAMGEGRADHNPVMGTNKVAEEKPRDRVLSDAELAAIWTHCADTDYGRIVRLLMLTAQRRDEIGSLWWSEIEGEGKTALIALPGSRTKNGRPHDVPMSKDALAILPPKRPGRDLVFGDGEGGFAGWSKAKEALDKACKVKEWTLHDLRRTAATRMADSGVLPHVVEAVLNHVSGHKAGVAGVNNRAAYATEKRQALDALAAYIKTAVAKASGANVTRLKRR